MRVAYISADRGVPVFGRKGCSVHVQEMVRALLNQGACVELFTCSTGGEPPADLRGVPVHPIPDPGAKHEGEDFEYTLIKNNWIIQRVLAENGAFEMVYERYSLFSFGAMTHAKVAGVPGVLEVNAPLIEEAAIHRALNDRGSAELVARKVFNEARLIFSVSSEVSEYVRGFMKEGAATSLHVVPNGVNPARFPEGLKPSAPADPGVFTIGFVGTLKPWHGLTVLLDALFMLSPDKERTRLLVVGDGPEREALKRGVEKYDLGKITLFTGAVSHKEVPGLLASMDVAVAPYPKLDNFYFSPLKVYEYMAAGLPVIASNTGQLGELIQDGWNGTLLEPGNVGALAKAVENLRLNPELRWFMGRVARKTVLKNHTWNDVVRKILSAAFPKYPEVRNSTWKGGNNVLQQAG